MRMVALTLTLCLAAPFPVLAAPEGSPLTASASREATRLAVTLARQPAQSAAKDSTWIARHPTLFAALVGAGAGTVGALVMDNEWFCSGGDEDCFFHGGSRALVGAGVGAGAGALVGWLVGKMSNGAAQERKQR